MPPHPKPNWCRNKNSFVEPDLCGSTVWARRLQCGWLQRRPRPAAAAKCWLCRRWWPGRQLALRWRGPPSQPAPPTAQPPRLLSEHRMWTAVKKQASYWRMSRLKCSKKSVHFLIESYCTRLTNKHPACVHNPYCKIWDPSETILGKNGCKSNVRLQVGSQMTTEGTVLATALTRMVIAFVKIESNQRELREEVAHSGRGRMRHQGCPDWWGLWPALGAKLGGSRPHAAPRVCRSAARGP